MEPAGFQKTTPGAETPVRHAPPLARPKPCPVTSLLRASAFSHSVQLTAGENFLLFPALFVAVITENKRGNDVGGEGAM